MIAALGLRGDEMTFTLAVAIDAILSFEGWVEENSGEGDCRGSDRS